jgi:hypothetical protein
MPLCPLLHAAFSEFDVFLFQLLRLLGKGMEQNDLIPQLKEIENTILIGAMMNSQLPDLPSDDVSIGPFQIRPLLFEQRQMRCNLCPGLLIQAIEKLINRRVASLSRVQDKIEQSALRTALSLYIIFDVMSSGHTRNINVQDYWLSLSEATFYWISIFP